MIELKNCLARLLLLLARPLLVVSLTIMCAPSFAQTGVDLEEWHQYVRQVCPKPWEDMTAQITYQQNADIWQNDLSDKTQFVKYASDFLKDDEHGFYIRSFSDAQAIIYICGNLKTYVFEVLHDDATAAVDSFNILSLIDTDQDLVMDWVDSCLDTPLGETVDAQGCSFDQRDDDNDGVLNGVDLCFGTLTGESVNVDGCALTQLDSDNDGVNDAIDQCDDPNEPPTQGTPNAEGCDPDQIDTDGDGTADYLDSYPHQSDSQCTV